MGGVGLYAVDADDADDVCGKGDHSLVKSLHTTVTALERKPRQLVRLNNMTVGYFRLKCKIDTQGLGKW